MHEEWNQYANDMRISVYNAKNGPPSLSVSRSSADVKENWRGEKKTQQRHKQRHKYKGRIQRACKRRNRNNNNNNNTLKFQTWKKKTKKKSCFTHLMRSWFKKEWEKPQASNSRAIVQFWTILISWNSFTAHHHHYCCCFPPSPPPPPSPPRRTYCPLQAPSPPSAALQNSDRRAHQHNAASQAHHKRRYPCFR